MTFQCWKCDGPIELASGEKVSRGDECARCGADVRCCRNCEFYDPSKHNQCAETQAEWVRDKEASNYCDYFRPRLSGPALSHPASTKSEEIKKRFDALFH